MGRNPAYLAAVHPIRKVSIAEQTAEHLREGIRSGRWAGELPGVLRLAADLEVSKGAVRDALHLLEGEGLLSPGFWKAGETSEAEVKKEAFDAGH